MYSRMGCTQRFSMNMMFEGSPTTRFQQVLAGIALGVCAIASFVICFFGAWRTYQREDWNTTSIMLIASFFLVGIGGLLVSYRLMTARGVKQGGGLLSPTQYAILGWLFIALSLLIGFMSIRDHAWKDLLISLFPVIFAGWCFTAARFRGGMRKIPEWQNKR